MVRVRGPAAVVVAGAVDEEAADVRGDGVVLRDPVVADGEVLDAPAEEEDGAEADGPDVGVCVCVDVCVC
ncbi:hypothetical protein [Catenulispora rubra]|uniref:hypothetical protein n=1 Tax=Catenulispora rubra TaxID=280293 RepID=UPI0018925EFF|nr:hypothetical protein [Catenulispora rubra]